MDKLSKIMEYTVKTADSTEIESLIQDLIGNVSLDSSTELNSNEVYQLPVKHTKDGEEINENNKPWVVGTFIPKQYINRSHPEGHNGMDLKAPHGSPIYPIASGIVIDTKQRPKGGNTIKISHEGGKVQSYYAHLDAVKVTAGDEVTPNSIIGTMGESGNAKGRGAHLHYEVFLNNSNINPHSITGKPVGSLSKKAHFIKQLIKKLDQEYDKG